jgi:hypothetical protein
MMPEDHGEAMFGPLRTRGGCGSDREDPTRLSRLPRPRAERSAETEGPAETEAAAAERRARLEAAKRSYRATLRNEADTGGGGFSEDYYRSQKPPHWS